MAQHDQRDINKPSPSNSVDPREAPFTPPSPSTSDSLDEATLSTSADLALGILSIPLSEAQIADDLMAAMECAPAIRSECEQAITSNPHDPLTRGFARQIIGIVDRFGEEGAQLAAHLAESRPLLSVDSPPGLTGASEILSWGATIARSTDRPELRDVATRLDLAARKLAQGLAA